MLRAMWNGAVLAENDRTTVVDGRHYFPPESIRWEHFVGSPSTSVCGWKGQAEYYTVVVGGEENPDAAWVYRTPKPAAAHIAGQIGFWRGVTVEATGTRPAADPDRGAPAESRWARLLHRS